MITKITISNRKVLTIALVGLIGLGVWIFHPSIAPVLVMLGDRQAIISYMQHFGSLGPLVLFLLLVAQVFIAVIPGHALMMAGGYIYGPLTAISITAFSTILGSQAAFWIARRYGRRLVNRLAKVNAIERWDQIANKQNAWFFFFAFVLPIFPSDLMCYVAGLGTVAPGGFLVANIAGRLLCAISITLIGSFGFHPPWQFVVLLLAGLMILFAAWGIYKRKRGLVRSKSDIAHALGMWICITYRRIFSIQMCIHGMENIPPGAKILAANHPNLSDAYLLPLLFDGKLRTLAQASQFRAPVLGWILTHTGQIPVHAEQRLAAYQLACQALAEGDTLLVFPEGRLNPDNKKINIWTGAVRMALKCGVPIIPIGIHVSQRDTLKLSSTSGFAYSRKLWQVRGKFNVQIGEAWSVGKDLAPITKPFEVHALSECLMEKIDSLRKRAAQESEK
jgi:1-acyl-sn-glycerol-3-phosphate acyltransferase